MQLFSQRKGLKPVSEIISDQWGQTPLIEWTEQGEVMLVTLFAKGNTGNIPAAKLKEIRRALEI